ncbi:NAD(P)-dependent oxidoreductase [Cyanobium sp. BA5m-21]|uniref:NAD-dependent epimerase/dehydratase family protein n=1 Tax=unclassified Cyanobium TaxID=2627006 RepID=UPI0020CEC833|nr:MULTISPECIES: NAD(P)-dependent oxidoreductase [unclassified Cyanobium]MCP9904719.1 NAD(P)-dependent oxidoreductase [Cyanobium sp. BA5m-10]MCP9907905.1 NAD(P)-dependent oxidoreductase [Cyanobium sp. BA5m-21]
MEAHILLTGGTGFFGRALLRHYLSCGMGMNASLCVLSRDPQRFQDAHPDLAINDQIRFVQADIQERETLPWNNSFTHILHAATDSTVGPWLTPLQRFNQVVEGTTNILDLAVATGARRFLLTSSGGIYGPQPSDLESIPEDWPGSPPLDQASTAYSQGKRAAEHLCALYRDTHGLQTVIARCFAFVGADLPLNVHFAIGNFIHDALSAEAITVSGDGTPLRTYLDQRDLAHWLWTLLQQGKDGEAYNVGADHVISIAELAHLVRDLIAEHKPVRILGIADPIAARSRYIPSIIKIETMHGLRPEITLEQAILNTAGAH